MRFRKLDSSLTFDESGQGMTEYGAVLAMVGIIVAAVFAFANGSFHAAVSQSFSTITSQLSSINTAAGGSGGGDGGGGGGSGGPM
jgi:Flp pilus assembly pilin Flp